MSYIFLWVYIPPCIFFLALLIRTQMVFNFRRKVIRLEYEHNCRKLEREKRLNGLANFYRALPSHESMIWSFKRIRLESYFSKEMIKELMS